MATGTFIFDCHNGPLIRTRVNAGDPNAFALLNHGGETLLPKTTLSDRLKQKFSVWKVLRFLVLPHVSPRENSQFLHSL